MRELTKDEKSVLLHTLGLDYGMAVFRNLFLAGEGHHDMPHILSLVELGLMAEGKHQNQGVYYHATRDGERLGLSLRIAMEPKLTRSQARYKRYMDCDSSMTFREWLTHPYGAKAYGL